MLGCFNAKVYEGTRGRKYGIGAEPNFEYRTPKFECRGALTECGMTLISNFHLRNSDMSHQRNTGVRTCHASSCARRISPAFSFSSRFPSRFVCPGNAW
jgi:hypothetical protein